MMDTRAGLSARPTRLAFSLLTLTLAAIACGGGRPTAPIAAPATLTPTPDPAPTPTPTPSPTPTPGVYPNGQTVVVRFTIKVSWVQDPDGNLRDPDEGIFVGDIVRFDSTGKDIDGNETAGAGDGPRWGWQPDELAMLSDTKGFNPRAKVKAAGEFFVEAHLDGVEAEPLLLEFKP